MRERLSLFISFWGVVAVLPCVLTFFLAGAGTLTGKAPLTVETCLPALTQPQLPAEFGMEMKKVQTVMVRSHVKKQLEEGHRLSALLYTAWQEQRKQAQMSLWQGEFASWKQAASQTRGEVLCWEGRPVEAPYHALSAGQTRKGEEVLEDGTFSYLAGVESPQDRMAPEYGTACYIPMEQLPADLEIRTRDGSGYVTALLADGQLLPGELFRMEMGLPSACFSMEQMGDSMRFFCKGKGHGLGLSQYGGGKMEQEGSTYIEILQYYFPNLALEKW